MRFIQDPKTFELVPADQYERPSEAGYYVHADIEPYRSMVTGEVIGSRSTHRAHLRQHQVIEVGNDPAALRAPGPMKADRRQIRESILQSIAEVNR